MSKSRSTPDPPDEDAVSLASTLRAFETGLTTSLTPEAGAAVADGWAAKIEASEYDELHGIARLLRQLSALLLSSPVDGRAVGDLLERIGAHTAEAAGSVSEDEALVEPLKQLGGYAKAAGIALAGGERPAEIAGVSTRVTGTPGDPTLRGVSAAPDVSPRTGGERLNAEVGDVKAIPSDETPGRTPYRPQ